MTAVSPKQYEENKLKVPLRTFATAQVAPPKAHIHWSTPGLGKALEIWQLTVPGIVIACIELDSLAQERALLEGRIAVGILVPSDRPVLQVRLLIKYPVCLALPKSHPLANKPEIP
jgi:DNA-binding transcriptional LysR family regulator